MFWRYATNLQENTHAEVRFHDVGTFDKLPTKLCVDNQIIRFLWVTFFIKGSVKTVAIVHISVTDFWYWQNIMIWRWFWHCWLSNHVVMFVTMKNYALNFNLHLVSGTLSLLHWFRFLLPRKFSFPMLTITAQKMKFSIKDFFSKHDQIRGNCGFDHIYIRNL